MRVKVVEGGERFRDSFGEQVRLATMEEKQAMNSNPRTAMGCIVIRVYDEKAKVAERYCGGTRMEGAAGICQHHVMAFGIADEVTVAVQQ